MARVLVKDMSPRQRRIRYSSQQLKASLRHIKNISGLDELADKLEEIGSLAGPEVVKVLSEAGDVAKRNVLSLTPLGPTGNLRRSIFRDSRDPYHDAKGPSILVGINHKIAPHWHFIELGTSKLKARPFFRQGIAKSVPTVSKLLQVGLKRIADRLAN